MYQVNKRLPTLLFTSVLIVSYYKQKYYISACQFLTQSRDNVSYFLTSMESHIFSVKTLLGFSFEFSIAYASHNHAFFKKNIISLQKTCLHFLCKGLMSLNLLKRSFVNLKSFCQNQFISLTVRIELFSSSTAPKSNIYILTMA